LLHAGRKQDNKQHILIIQKQQLEEILINYKYSIFLIPPLLNTHTFNLQSKSSVCSSLKNCFCTHYVQHDCHSILAFPSCLYTHRVIHNMNKSCPKSFGKSMSLLARRASCSLYSALQSITGRTFIASCILCLGRNDLAFFDSNLAVNCIMFGSEHRKLVGNRAVECPSCVGQLSHFCQLLSNPNIDLELEYIFGKPMKCRICRCQRFIAGTEILSTFHARVE